MPDHPRIRLATLPTPLHQLERVSELVAADVWIKRDDLTGFAMGGNKVRKAEFLLADALSQGCDVTLTAGAVQSNHARVIATASRHCGLECHLFLSGKRPESPSGNLLLDHLALAQPHFLDNSSERASAMRRFAEELDAQGRRPYVIPIGGSNAIGALGYVEFFRELNEQLSLLAPKPTVLVFGTSSGGTMAGLLAGRAAVESTVEILGVRVDHDPGAEETICEVLNELAFGLNLESRFDVSNVKLNSDYVGEGYGIATEEGLEAVRQLWQREGILLDPTYSGKAMAGLMGLAKSGRFEGPRVVFLHTGGAPAVFAHGLFGTQG